MLSKMSVIPDSDLLKAVVCFIAGTCLLYGILLVNYRLFWHPLASFPGSKLAASTKWYECFFDTLYGEGGQYAEKIRQMHERYGPIIRINPDEVHIHDPAFYGRIYAPLPARRDKYPPAAGMAGCPLGTFGTINHDKHRKRRAANSVFFSTKSVQAAQSLVYDRMNLLCQMLEKSYQDGKHFKVHTMILAFTSDVMSTYILGKPLGCQDDWEMAEQWDRTMRALPRVTPLVKQFPWSIRLALKLPMSLVKWVAPNLTMLVSLHKMMYEESELHARSRNVNGIPSEKASKTEHLTIFEAIDRSSLPADEKSVDRQAQEAFVLMGAGTETSARTIATLLYHLVANPDTYSRLRREINERFPDSSLQLSARDLEQIPYLTACIKESLRVMQLLTSRLPLVAYEDIHYGLFTIPAGTPVSMTINDILSDERIYEKPREFRPDRWLDEHGQLNNTYDAVFMPFGKGTRMCQGINLAWAEMYICTSQLIRRFDFELFDTIRSRDVDVTRDCFFGTTTESSPGVRMKIQNVIAAC